MINLDDISLFNDIRYRLAQVTPEQIVAAERRLKKKEPEDQVLGPVELETTRALYALWTGLGIECRLEKARSEGCEDEAEEKDHLAKAVVLDMIEDVVGEMWWTQAKMDVGPLESPVNVGIRSGWLLVKTLERSGPAMIARLMASGLPGMPGL